MSFGRDRRGWIRRAADSLHATDTLLLIAVVVVVYEMAAGVGREPAVRQTVLDDRSAPAAAAVQGPSSPGVDEPLRARALQPPRPEAQPELAIHAEAQAPMDQVAPAEATPGTAARSKETVIASLPPAAVAEAPEPQLDGIEASPGTNGSHPCSSSLASAIPQRRSSMPEGTAFISGLMNVSGGRRDEAVVHAVLQGNVPDFLRNLRPVRLEGTTADSRVEITICVTPDYLAVGSDRDNVRVPLGLAGALRVANAFGMILPTKRTVDAIYRQASVRVEPQPMQPGPQMSSTDFFLRHDRTVDAQLAQAGARKGQLVAGIKKDVVLTNRLGRAPGRVAIYGWHRTNGRAIQPLTTVHGAAYADYSHGIRLISRTAFLDGQPVDLRALLTDARYAGLLNDDGVLTRKTTQVALLR